MQIFEPSRIEFNCPCSEQKAFNSVMMLGDDEIKQLLNEQGKINSNCEFCRAEYSFDEAVLIKPTNKGQSAH
jgi:molecular chaperone Hsp33